MAASPARLLTARSPPWPRLLELYASLVATTWPLPGKKVEAKLPRRALLHYKLARHRPSSVSSADATVVSAWHRNADGPIATPGPAVGVRGQDPRGAVLGRVFGLAAVEEPRIAQRWGHAERQPGSKRDPRPLSSINSPAPRGPRLSRSRERVTARIVRTVVRWKFDALVD